MYAIRSYYACTGTGIVPCYLYDYDIVEIGAEYGFTVGRMPVSLWVDYITNTAIDDLNQGYNVGFKLGKAGDPGSWEIAALYSYNFV